jgi:NitT/TauT family transport system substrate-binding protein
MAPPSSPRSAWRREKPALVQRFVRASMEGWKSYMADPAPANALIKKDNPNMTDEQLAYASRSSRRTS